MPSPVVFSTDVLDERVIHSSPMSAPPPFPLHHTLTDVRLWAEIKPIVATRIDPATLDTIRDRVALDNESLFCAICHTAVFPGNTNKMFGQLVGPPRACANKHAYCALCIDKWHETTDTCPTCKSSEFFPCPRLSEVYFQQVVPCESSACKWTGKVEEYASHCDSCPFVRRSCPFWRLGCDASHMTRDELGKHLATTDHEPLIDQVFEADQMRIGVTGALLRREDSLDAMTHEVARLRGAYDALYKEYEKRVKECDKLKEDNQRQRAEGTCERFHENMSRTTPTQGRSERVTKRHGAPPSCPPSKR